MQPKLKTSEVLAHLQALDRTVGPPDDITRAKLRREIEPIQSLEYDSYRMLLSVLFGASFNIEETKLNAWEAFQSTSNPIVASNAVLSLVQSGDIKEALLLSNASLGRFPSNPSVLNREYALAFESGQVTRAKMARDKLKKMKLGYPDFPLDEAARVLVARGRTEDDVTDVIAAARLFFSAIHRRIKNWNIWCVDPYEDIRDHLHYIFNLGESMEKSLEIEDDLLTTLRSKQLAAYCDETVLVSLSTMETPAEQQNEHDTEAVN